MASSDARHHQRLNLFVNSMIQCSTVRATWLIRAVTLGVLAITLPLAARGLYGLPGGLVNIRWQPSVDVAERQRLETEWDLVDGQEVSPSTWRYDLTAPSEGRLRAIVTHAAVADTHDIDRERFTLAPEAPRTARRHGLITAGGAIAVGVVDRLAMILATLSVLCVLFRPDRARGAPGRRGAPTRRAGRAGTIAVVVAPGVCLIAFAAVVMHMTGEGDHPYHIDAARLLAENNEWLPHFGYHAAVIVVHALTPADWVDASGIVMLGGIAAGAGVVAWWLRGVLRTQAFGLLVVAAFVPAALFVLQPVLPFDPTGYDAWLFGYFPPNQWHSPTTLFSKPFALLLLGLGPAVVWPTHGTRAGRTRMLTSAGLLVMSCLVKPNFIMAFLPALGALAVLHWRHTDWRWLGLSFILPTAAVLAWQYGMTLNIERGGVILAPLHVIGFRSPTDLVTLGWRLAASVLFPLAAVACFPSVRADRRVQLGWATFVIGAAIGYLLAESVLVDDGAFLWSGQLAVFVLFAASAVAVLRAAATGGAGLNRLSRFALCGNVFLWHVTSGIRHLSSTWLA